MSELSHGSTGGCQSEYKESYDLGSEWLTVKEKVTVTWISFSYPHWACVATRANNVYWQTSHVDSRRSRSLNRNYILSSFISLFTSVPWPCSLQISYYSTSLPRLSLSRVHTSHAVHVPETSNQYSQAQRGNTMVSNHPLTDISYSSRSFLRISRRFTLSSLAPNTSLRPHVRSRR
jgi:hypothetical protein